MSKGIISITMISILLPIIAGLGILVYNYRNLQKTVIVQRDKITELTNTLKLTREISEANLKKIKQLEDTIEVNSKAVSTLCTLNNEVTTRTNEVIITRRKREKAISRSYTDASKKIDIKGGDFFKKFDIAINEDNQLSEARIDSLWVSYCSNKECEDRNEDNYQDDGITK